MVSLFGRGFESLQLHSIIYYKKSLSFSGFILFTQKKKTGQRIFPVGNTVC